MKIKRNLITIISIIFILFPFVSASVNFDSSSLDLKKTYNLGDKISGSIELDLYNESSESLLSTNIASKKIKLIDWLKQAGKRLNIDYNCSSYNCIEEYSIIKEANSLSMDSEESKVIGFKLIGDNVKVKSFSFEVNTDFPNSCTNPFSIEIAEKQDKILNNYRYTESVCGNTLKGCFDSSLSQDMYLDVQLKDNPYCERIKLYPAPAHSFTSNLTKTVENKMERISYELYDENFNIKYGNCSVNSGIGSCVIAHPVREEKYYHVCIYSNQSESNYKIRTEQHGNKCGSVGINGQYTVDFDIIANALTYSNSPQGKILFDNDKFALLNNEENLTALFNDYLKEKYASNCSLQGCFIPFRVFVSEDQSLTLTNPSLTYESNGLPTTQNKIYEIEERYPTLDADNLKISFESADLTVNNKATNMQISLGRKLISRSSVTINVVPVSIKPSFSLIGVDSEFFLQSNLTIDSVTWKFSDQPSKIYTTKTVKRSFEKQGNYSVSADVLTSQGKFSLTQQIVVGDPRESAEELMSDSEKNIGAISSGINTVPQWIKPNINEKINVVVLNNSLKTIKEKLEYATNDSEYLQIINEIQELGIPDSFGIIRTGSFPLISAYNNLNLDYMEAIYDEEQANSEQTRASILEWTRDNYDADIELVTYGAAINDESQSLLTKVKITLNPKSESNSQRYLIIDYPIEAIQFKEGYSQKEVQSGTYISLDNTEVIEFYVEEDMTLDNLGVYIMPALSELQEEGYAYEIIPSSEDKVRKVVYISLTIIFLFVVVITIILQYWYRHSYEKHLFEKEESLFNIMTFIHNSKKNNLKEGDMRKQLLNSGWTREQISYALGKFEGKILGIFGLPIYSARQEKNISEDVENRQRQFNSRKVY